MQNKLNTNPQNSKVANEYVGATKDQQFYDKKQDSSVKTQDSSNIESTLQKLTQQPILLQSDINETKKELVDRKQYIQITKTQQIPQQNKIIDEQEEYIDQPNNTAYDPVPSNKQQQQQQQQQKQQQKPNSKIQIQIQQQQQYQQQQQQQKQQQQQQSQSKLQQQGQEYQDLIQNLIQSKISKIELNNNQIVQSLIFFQNQNKPDQQDPLISSKQKDKFQTEFRNKFLNLEHKKQIINPLQLVINQNYETNPMEVLFYVLSDQMRRANRSFFTSLQPDESLMFSFQGQFTADSQDTQAYSLTLKETEKITYSMIASNEPFRQNFINQLTKCLAIDLKVQSNQIQIVAIEKGSIKVIFEVIDPSGAVHSSENFQELQRLYPGTTPQLQLHDYFKIAALSVNDFEPKYNMQWNDFNFGNHGQRGPQQKTQPYFYPVGWDGYGLKVSGRYGQNDNWLQMNQNTEEWYVMFHGTKFKAVKSILNQGLKEGYMQAHQNELCLLTNKVIGKGVYFSNHIEVCDGFTEPTQIGNDQFRLAFQSRVKPEALRQCKKTTALTKLIAEFKQHNRSYDPSLDKMDLWNDDYFVINKTCDIRPYRILLKKLKKRQ